MANLRRPFALFTFESFLQSFLLIALVMIAWALWIGLRNPNTRAHRRTREALGPRCRAMPAREFDALLESGVENDNFAD